jgi:hypothetical protein
VPNETTTLDNTTVITPPDDDIVSFEDVFGLQNIAFTAQPFVQDASIASEQTEIEVDVIWAIRVDNVLYSSVKISNDPTIVYPQKLYLSTDKSADEVYEILGEIQNAESCYMLESEADHANVKKLAVYNINGIHYLLTFHENGIVAQIYCVNISEAELYAAVEDERAWAWGYALSAKIPTKWKVADGDIPILLSFGATEENSMDTDLFSNVIFTFGYKKDFYEFKRIDTVEILKPDYVAKVIWDKEREEVIGYDYAHTEALNLPLFLLSDESGSIIILMKERGDNGIEGGGAIVELSYVCDGENIFISN